MTRQEKTHLIESCIGKKQLVRMFFKYEKPYWYYYPNAVNDQFILGQEEDDFLLDGYHIRRIKDLVKVEIKDDLCAQINIWNGTVNGINNPGIDISSWQSIFRSPVLQNTCVIIEDDYNESYEIGYVRKACDRYLLLNSFDADGMFNNKPIKIPYSRITHLAWKTRYAENWHQYLMSHNMPPAITV